ARLRPVAPALEGVGGQVDPVSGGEHGGPVGFRTRCVEPAEGRRDGVLFVVVLALQRNEDAVMGLLGDGRESGIGPDLDVAGDATVGEPLEMVAEADGVADVAYPVLR